MRRKAAAVTMALGLAGVLGMGAATRAAAQAQEPGPPAAGQEDPVQPSAGQQAPGREGFDRSQFAGMQRVGGEVTAISGANVTVKAEDGGTYQIVTTDNTRLMKGRGVPLKLADLKVGDGVMAAGNLDAPAKTLHAALLFATDGAQLREARANLGKTFIQGKVTAIDLDNAKMTIERADNVSQTIGFDESSSFRRGGRGGRGTAAEAAPGGATGAAAAPAAEPAESITLADIKVGDRVRGNGSLKNGVFVPTQLIVMAPGQGGGAGAGGPRGAGPAGGGPAGGGPGGGGAGAGAPGTNGHADPAASASPPLQP